MFFTWGRVIGLGGRGGGKGEGNKIGFVSFEDGTFVVALGASGSESVVSFAPTNVTLVPVQKMIALVIDVSKFIDFSHGRWLVAFGACGGNASAYLKQASANKMRMT